MWGLSHPRPPKNTLAEKVNMTGACLFDRTRLRMLSESLMSEMLPGLGPQAPPLPFTLWQASAAGRCQGQEHKKYFCKWGITILFFPWRMEVFLRLPGAFAGTIGWRRGRPGPGRTKSLCGGLLRAGFVLPGSGRPRGAPPQPLASGPAGSLAGRRREKHSRGCRDSPPALGAAGGGPGDVTMGATQGSAGSGPREPDRKSVV